MHLECIYYDEKKCILRLILMPGDMQILANYTIPLYDPLYLADS